jgi:hypothetical protein
VVATRWVATVGSVFAAIEPSPRYGVLGWIVITASVVVRLVRHRWRQSAERVPI